MSSTNLRGRDPPPSVPITVDGVPLTVAGGAPLAACLLAVGIRRLRASPRLGAPRGGFCFMGTCQECVLLVDGARVQSCLVPARAGMVVVLGTSGSA